MSLEKLMIDGRELPKILQAGMGAGVSNYVLARAVARLGHLGVVSGTGIGTIMTRRLQEGGSKGSPKKR